MRDVTLTVYDYAELDESAKKTAFENWQLECHNDELHRTSKANKRRATDIIASEANKQRAAAIIKTLKAIENKIGVSLAHYYYTKAGHGFTIDTDNGLIRQDKFLVKGVRAGKIALQMYRDLTEVSKPLYARFRGADRRYTFAHYENIDTYRSRADGYRKTRLPKLANEDFFVASIFSRVFASALLASVKNNYTKNYSTIDHLDTAYTAMFKEIVRHYNYEHSYLYFKANVAIEHKYFADGSVLDKGKNPKGVAV